MKVNSSYKCKENEVPSNSIKKTMPCYSHRVSDTNNQGIEY